MKTTSTSRGIETSTVDGSKEIISIADTECHILTFSEEAVALGQSANYLIGSDIVLHVVVNKDESTIVINNCEKDVWQKRSVLDIPKSESSPYNIAIFFQPTNIIVAMPGVNISRTITRDLQVTSEPVTLDIKNSISIRRIFAPARIPAGVAILDFFGLFPNGSTVLCGWITYPWTDEDNIYVAIDLGNVRFRLPAEVLWYSRPDLDDNGTGYILSFVLPPEIEVHPDTLLNMSVEIDFWSYRLSPHHQTRLFEAEQARGWMTEVLPRIYDGNITQLREVISRPVFSGSDTLASLSAPCHLETDIIYSIAGKGIMLLGWFVDPLASVRSIRICSGRLRSTEDLRDAFLAIERTDVKSAFENQYDLPSSKLGFLAYSALDHKGGNSLYAEIELNSGEVGFKPLSAPVPAGLPAVRRILENLKVTGDEIQHAFDNVIGTTLVAINRGRLKKDMHVSEVRLGKTPDIPRCSIIVPLYGRLDFLEYQCALFSQGGIEFDELIYVLDEPGRKAELLNLARLCYAKFCVPMRLIFPAENRGFGPASNLGLRYATGQYICFLNSDIFPENRNWLDKLIESSKTNPKIGAVGALCLFADGSVQHVGMDYESVPHFGGWMFPKHPGKGFKPSTITTRLRDVPGITGACMVIARELAEELGGFDLDYVIGDFEDADLCNKIVAMGLRCVVDQSVVLYHLERQSQGNQAMDWRINLTLLNAWTFNKKWY
ncbi:glycosyltransferase [Paracoccus liaowanqingii]|uniref:Glycosyltransferase n=1 Tax=Paracoccus liaowanqingii TaxID=2560053 RepID=A0A4Z1CRR8_9RHOB|nr:glycosyltransferase [Paracoccus liaowanqingii]TGN68025.1 glycosyltransferase [Paracoccus liaowanqingii]